MNSSIRLCDLDLAGFNMCYLSDGEHFPACSAAKLTIRDVLV
jgi:hypothetical protein